LLTASERRTGHDAKKAARQIARQVIWKCGLPVPQRALLSTDAAEAILVGYWATAKQRKVGIDLTNSCCQTKDAVLRKPAYNTLVDRYSNGNVIEYWTKAKIATRQ
jgi:hypothetical protein